MNNNRIKVLILASVCFFLGMIIYMAFTYDEIPGNDEKLGVVVAEYAEKAGVAEREPYINTDRGDILLFLFCFAGIVSGFYLGYNWKIIISEKSDIHKYKTVSRN